MDVMTTVIRCGVCGAPLCGTGSIYKCEYCGNVSHRGNPALEDELMSANALRECSRFDEAQTMYKQIVKKYKGNDLSEVYWNMLLCEQRVMLETNEKGEHFPSFYAIVSDEVTDSPYYECAISQATQHASERVAIFEKMAEKMANAKLLYTRIRESEKPYDVFVCFKKSKTDGSGAQTPDTELANDLYNEFCKSYKVFFSERTLRDVSVRDYEPNIYYALYTAKVMLLLCSKKEYLEAQWVKNEWSRYASFAQNPATGKTVIPIFLEDFAPEDLPAVLQGYQGLQDNRHLFTDLEGALRKILKPIDMEAEMKKMLEEQQHRFQEQIDAMRKEQENMRETAEHSAKEKQEREQKEAQRRAQAAPHTSAVPMASPLSHFEIKNGVLKKYKGKSGTVVIPDGVKEIGGGAFSECENLTSITIPKGVTFIGESAFELCKNLTSITIPEGVTSIDDNAFFGCENLTSITIPEGITSIGGWAFFGCKNLTSITIPEGVASIGDNAFYGCNHLTSITIPKGVTSIGDNAFQYCENLTSITIPEGVTSIGKLAFYECKNLTSITIPEGVSSINESVFSGCENLTSITIPEGVTSIGKLAFYECKNLTSITIPKGVTSIGDRAFHWCENLTSITIPQSVTSIGKHAFFVCENLTLITIPEGVTSIGEGAFSRCKNLTSITIPKSVISLGERALDSDYVKTVTYPAHLKKEVKKQFGSFERKKIKFNKY